MSPSKMANQPVENIAIPEEEENESMSFNLDRQLLED